MFPNQKLGSGKSPFGAKPGFMKKPQSITDGNPSAALPTGVPKYPQGETLGVKKMPGAGMANPSFHAQNPTRMTQGFNLPRRQGMGE